MNILIIGCNGFIGSHTFRYFTEKSYEVTGCDITQVSNKSFLLLSDLSNLNLLLQNNKFDACINASGSSTVGFSIQNQDQDYVLNFKNVQTILEGLIKYQPHCKFINLSSAAVYGNPEQLPIKEDAPAKPISPYGKHKLLSEQLMKDFTKQFHCKALSLRVFSVYGPGLKKQLFWDIYQKSKQNNTIELFGTGDETRDFIFIDDLMKALEIIILKANFDGSVINVASGKAITIEQAANTFIKCLGSNLNLNFNGISKQADPVFWQADISRLQKLGFEANIDIEKGLKKYALWLQELN